MKSNIVSQILASPNVNNYEQEKVEKEFQKAYFFRGRQLARHKQSVIKINISNYSTCETKRRITNKSPKPRRGLMRKQRKDESYSSSSSDSDSFKKYKKLKYYGITDNDAIEYPSRKDVGLISSDDESQNTTIIEENWSGEIERILIEIYNKNISINRNSKSSEINQCENTIDSYFVKMNKRNNLIVLKILSDKIKELIIKYKEKIYELPEIKKLYEVTKYGRTKRLRPDLEFFLKKSKVNPLNFTDTDEIMLKNSLLLKFHSEITEQEITNNLLRELINVKNTLKLSSKEIDYLFRYPLSLLKETGFKDNNIIEKIQLEQFQKILLGDCFIKNLIAQIKKIFVEKVNIIEIANLIKEVEDVQHENEMTKLDEFLNKEINSSNDDNQHNNRVEGSSLAFPSKETVFTLTSASSVESNEKNEIPLDELVKYISEDSPKPKKKKNKKGKKKIEHEEPYDEVYNSFKEDLLSSSVYAYNWNKITPAISKEFLEEININNYN